jgi:hypothetical protein
LTPDTNYMPLDSIIDSDNWRDDDFTSNLPNSLKMGRKDRSYLETQMLGWRTGGLLTPILN